MHSNLKIYNTSFSQYINVDFELTTLADDCLFTEGPVWSAEGFYLFSDIAANCVYAISPGNKKKIHIQNSGTDNVQDPLIKHDQAGSNALAFDKNGHLLVCRHGSHMIARWKNNSLQPFITHFNSKPFNSPNDLVVDEKGRLFFSDPPYGLHEGKINNKYFQPLAGVYCCADGLVSLVCDIYQYPNGVCITPDNKHLYICSNKPFENFISVYNLANLQFEGILANENSDGIKCDRHGHVYLCNRDGLIIIDRWGQRLAKISLPTIPANICIGGNSGNDLFITARENVFLIKNFLC